MLIKLRAKNRWYRRYDDWHRTFKIVLSNDSLECKIQFKFIQKNYVLLPH